MFKNKCKSCSFINPFDGISTFDLMAIENVSKRFGLSEIEFMQRVAVSVSKEYYIARHYLTTEVTIDLNNLENVELNKQFFHIFGIPKK